MPRAEVGHYVHVHDQYHNFECEGFFVAERDANIKTAPGFGDITIHITKILKETNPGQMPVGENKLFPTPRYVPIFIREMTENERLLYV